MNVMSNKEKIIRTSSNCPRRIPQTLKYIVMQCKKKEGLYNFYLNGTALLPFYSFNGVLYVYVKRWKMKKAGEKEQNAR